MKRYLLGCIFAAGSLFTVVNAANAVPNVGANHETLKTAASKGVAEHVHYRNWRHNHRRIYRRDRYYGDGYGYRRAPSIYFSFGQSRRYRDYDFDNYRGYDRRTYGYRDYDRGYW